MERDDANEELMARLTDTIQHARELGLSADEVRLLCLGTGIPRPWFDPGYDGQEELPL